MTYSLQQLHRTAERLKTSTYEGVQGVLHVESDTPGPAVGITVCTHGNEPAGLAAAQFLLDLFDKNGKSLIRGSLFIVLNNIQATEKYFSILGSENTSEARYMDTNLNRLPENLNESNSSYEIRRARELLPIWSKFEIGLDIHSTTQDAGEMIISLGNNLRVDLIAGFPIPRIVSNIDTIQIGHPAIYFYGKNSKIPSYNFAIECGRHESPTSFDKAVICSKSLLQTLEMLPGKPNNLIEEYEEYVVKESVVFPDYTYHLTRLFENFEFVSEGTILAQGDGPNLQALNNCHTLFASRVKPENITEEVMFLTLPKQSRKVG